MSSLNASSTIDSVKRILGDPYSSQRCGLTLVIMVYHVTGSNATLTLTFDEGLLSHATHYDVFSKRSANIVLQNPIKAVDTPTWNYMPFIQSSYDASRKRHPFDPKS